MSKSELKKIISGFTLLEVMVSVGILGIIVLIATGFMVNMENDKRVLKDLASRDALGNRIARIASSPTALRASLVPGNEALINCATENGQTCTATNIANPQPFTLFVPWGRTRRADYTNGDAVETEFIRAVAGAQSPYRQNSNDEGVVWSRNIELGQMSRTNLPVYVCADRNDQYAYRCPFVAKSWFWASCTGSCDKASTINIIYQISPRTNAAGEDVYKDKYGGKSFQPYPPAKNLAELIRFSTAISTDDINPDTPTAKECGDPNARQHGTDTEGDLICKCLSTHIEISAPNIMGGVRCTAKNLSSRCNDDEKAVGFNDDGSIKCEKKKVVCQRHTSCDNENGCSCKRIGGVDQLDIAEIEKWDHVAWIHSFHIEGCKKVPGDAKKGIGDRITCDQDNSYIECCYYQ